MRRRIITLAGIGTLLGFVAVGAGQNRRHVTIDYDHHALADSAASLKRASQHFERELIRRHRGWGDLSHQAGRFQRDAARFSYNLSGRGGGYALSESYRRVRQGYFDLRRRFHHNAGFTSDERPAYGDDGYYRVLRSWLHLVESFNRLDQSIGRFGFGAGGGGHPHGGATDPGVTDLGPFDNDFHTTSIRCKSDNYRRNSCHVGGIIEHVEVRKRKSRAACIPGRTFGLKGGSVWVDRGCDAEFRVTYRSR